MVLTVWDGGRPDQAEEICFFLRQPTDIWNSLAAAFLTLYFAIGSDDKFFLLSVFEDRSLAELHGQTKNRSFRHATDQKTLFLPISAW